VLADARNGNESGRPGRPPRTPSMPLGSGCLFEPVEIGGSRPIHSRGSRGNQRLQGRNFRRRGGSRCPWAPTRGGLLQPPSRRRASFVAVDLTRHAGARTRCAGRPSRASSRWRHARLVCRASVCAARAARPSRTSAGNNRRPARVQPSLVRAARGSRRAPSAEAMGPSRCQPLVGAPVADGWCGTAIMLGRSEGLGLGDRAGDRLRVHARRCASPPQPGRLEGAFTWSTENRTATAARRSRCRLSSNRDGQPWRSRR